jgi:thioredoxin 2
MLLRSDTLAELGIDRETFATNDRSNTTIKRTRETYMQIVACKNCGTRNRVDEQRLKAGEAKCGRCGTELEQVSGKPFVVTDATFQSEILESSHPLILVDAWAPWCGPCRAIAPVLDQLAAESEGRYAIAKLNVDENPRIATQFHISSIPTMLFFKQGKLVDRLIGAHPKSVIVQHLANVT